MPSANSPTSNSAAAAAAAAASAGDDPADLRALRLLLRQSRDFRLALALYNDPIRRDAWIRALAAELAPAGVRVLTLDLLHDRDQDRGLLDRVQALAATVPPGERGAIMVVNMETLVDYAPELSRPGGPGTAFLDSANLQRENFPAACPGPLVLWMAETLEQAFVRCAPDLWSWRNHVFDLRTRRAPAAPVADADGRPFRSDDDRLHPETRLRRLEEELAAHRQARSRPDEMRVLNAIGIARLDVGDARHALLDFEEARRIAREIGDRSGEGAALGNLGNAHADLGDARKAIEFYEQRLVIAREIGDRRGEGNALGNLGVAHKNLGDARKAIEFYEQQLVIVREIGDRRGEGNALGNLGNAHAAFGDARQAIEFYEQQLVIAREIGDRRGEGNALWNSADELWKMGNRPEAIARAAAALAIYKAIEDPWAAKVRARLAEWREGKG